MPQHDGASFAEPPPAGAASAEAVAADGASAGAAAGSAGRAHGASAPGHRNGGSDAPAAAAPSAPGSAGATARTDSASACAPPGNGDSSSDSSVRLVIFDLDGTVLDTESLVLEVAGQVVARHGATLTPAAIRAGSGRRPLESWQAVKEELGISDEQATAQQLLDESEPLLKDRWHEAALMPGAARLLHHLYRCGTPVALATSTPRRTYERKMSGRHAPLAQLFAAVHCGDEVPQGKPAPDCFQAAAAKLGVPPAQCLVVEDAPAGVEAAAAAGMRVVVVPSLLDRDGYPQPDAAAATGCCEVLASLFDFRPERYGLPPFGDLAAGTVPMEPPWRLRGTVVKGFGRGSRELGIPTANLDADSLRGALGEAVTGIYGGWARVGASPDVYPMVMSIGWNPFYQNKEKTAEPWILHTFDADFYGEELRLLVCAYLRPEANFSSLEALVAQIHDDARVMRQALADARLAQYQHDAFFH